MKRASQLESETQGGVEHLVRLHGQDALFAHVSDGAALMQVGMAEAAGHSAFLRSLAIRCSSSESPGRACRPRAGISKPPALLVAGLRRDQDIHRPAQDAASRAGLTARRPCRRLRSQRAARQPAGLAVRVAARRVRPPAGHRSPERELIPLQVPPVTQPGSWADSNAIPSQQPQRPVQLLLSSIVS